MENSFNLRVDKIFGSLNSSSSSSSSAATPQSSLWRLTDAEIPRREWKRDNTSPEPPRLESLSNVNREYSAQLDDEPCVTARLDDQYWEVKSSIGLDCTLDYEEEEDEHDKVAVGNVRGMEESPLCFKDPRANHLAAKLRLKEDDEAILSFNPKSILKRSMDNQLYNKSHKRVRFDPQCVGFGFTTNTDTAKDDYLLNRHGYTRYTLDSSSECESQVNEDSNKKAYIEFLQSLGDSRSSQEAEAFDTLRSVTFVPRKKRSDGIIIDTELLQSTTRRHVPTSITDDNNTVCAMEEDDVPSASASKRIATPRQYRTKPRSDLDD